MEKITTSSATPRFFFENSANAIFIGNIAIFFRISTIYFECSKISWCDAANYIYNFTISLETLRFPLETH